MQPITHLCGQQLTRARGPLGAYVRASAAMDADQPVPVARCPRCNEALADVDCRDADGQPLTVEFPSDWARARRAALADLAAAGYTLSWEDGYWRLGAADIDYPLASSDNLDAIVELASAITTGQTPIRLYWNWLHGGTEHVWEGVWNEASGVASGPSGRLNIVITGQRVEVSGGPLDAPQIGRVWRRTPQLIEVELFAGS